MPTPFHVWTAPLDARLRRMRAEGSTWVTIATALAVSPALAIERALRIGAIGPVAGPRFVAEDPAREPLPAGHPRAWGVLTDGTWLQGITYPEPVRGGMAP